MSHMEEDHHHHHHQEMQLLSYNTKAAAQFPSPSHSNHHQSSWGGRFGPGPSLDLQLSISVGPMARSVEALKWEAAEQIRLAAMEKAYAEHVMEMTRREMEVAQSEFIRARSLWDRAREEVERAEKIRDRAAAGNSISNCMEITCFSCSQKFRP